jgi:AcrR family transcriptional regulator
MNDLTTKERILSVAEKKFVSLGIANTQMKDIANELNINRRTLYRYFPTKDELAFEIELIVMGRIQNYFGALINEADFNTGFEKVKAYFEKVDIDGIKELMKFTGEFDRYFQNDYPNKEMEKSFLEVLNPENDPLYQYIAEGIADGSIRTDVSARELFHLISHSFFALFQRLILRENHLNEEYCDDIDFKKVFKKVILSGLKK